MDTIKNYLEMMFQNLPNTVEVRKAHDELLSMMEDKYDELISEGKPENEAVAQVISEFGNLDELAESLGISKVINEKKEEVPRRKVSLSEIKECISDKTIETVLKAIGVALCINCADGFIMSMPDVFSIANLFVFIGLAVGLFIFGGVFNQKWNYLYNEPCLIDYDSVNYLSDEREKFRTKKGILLALGVVLIVISVIPCAIAGSISHGENDAIGTVMMMIMIAAGVVLIIIQSGISNTYKELLSINDENTISGNYVAGQNESRGYNNKAANTIMELYWPTVTCLYLTISFLTFTWTISWIIWPIAGIFSKVLDIIFRNSFGKA